MKLVAIALVATFLMTTAARACFPSSGSSGPFSAWRDHLVSSVRSFDSGAYELAVAEASHSLKLWPTPTAYNVRGACFKRMNKYSWALRDFDKAIEMRPSEAQYYRNRGVTYAAMNKDTKAFLDLNKAIALEPKYQQAYKDRAELNAKYRRSKKVASDEAQYIALKDTPQDFGWFEPSFAAVYSSCSDYWWGPNRLMELRREENLGAVDDRVCGVYLGVIHGEQVDAAASPDSGAAVFHD